MAMKSPWATLTALLLGLILGGCAPKVDTRFQAPPPGANARPDPPPDPEKIRRLPTASPM
jgi:hypothetical protein